jgi:hypothetical protein
MRRREYAGSVWVDHGRVVVCDPVYVDVSEADEKKLPDGGDCLRLDLGDTERPGRPPHLAVAVASGFGDGYFPVIVEYAEVDGEEFVSKLVVDFLVEHDDEIEDVLRHNEGVS